jgi:hypothetical protein
MPRAKISGGVSKLTGEKKEKVKYSGYHITLNGNQRFPDKTDPRLKEEAEKFSSVVHNMLEHIEDYVQLGEGDAWDDDKVVDVQADYAIERGSKSNNLHCHLFIQVRHHNKGFHLNYRKIKEDTAKALGLKTVYFNSRLLRRGGEPLDVKEYVSKNLY